MSFVLLQIFKANLLNLLLNKLNVCNDFYVVNKTDKYSFFCSQLEVFKPAPVRFCTDFTSTANATVSTYGRDVLREGTLLQAVRVVQDSHLLKTHPYLQPTTATIPNRHSFAGKYWINTFIRTIII
ncbi:hypothetical protein RF11_09978 [Thelohanellus kitauei]|uniref:Uncharacterized protein n=1 Tax=Thelohanellus kitauei TaxID=669202 RepID=A0A0C2N338_THEKT|nr:hypothetical protein RF11_09978 [Thelohanellus kitauei]